MVGTLLVVGAGQIGAQVAKEYWERGNGDVAVHCLTREESARAARALASAGVSVVDYSWGDVVEGVDGGLESEVWRAPSAHQDLLAPIGALSRHDRHPIRDLVAAVRPAAIVDAMSTATTLSASRSIHRRAGGVAQEGADVDTIHQALAINALVRYTYALCTVASEFGVSELTKVSTTALGGMGIDMLFTHGDYANEILSPEMWRKLILAGTQLQLLATLSRSKGASIHCVVPGACVGFDDQMIPFVARTPVRHPGAPLVPDFLSNMEAGEFSLTTIGSGENLSYTAPELAILTEEMGAVTKEEIASSVVDTLTGKGASVDVVERLESATIRGTMAGATRASAIIKEARTDSRGNEHSLTTGHLGPHFSKVIVELYLAQKSAAHMTNPRLLEESAVEELSRTPSLSAQVSTVGLGIRSQDWHWKPEGWIGHSVDLRGEHLARIGAAANITDGHVELEDLVRRLLRSDAGRAFLNGSDE